MQSSLTDEELSLRSLAGIFYVLIVGMVVAIAVSFLEFFCSSNKNKDPQRLKVNFKSEITFVSFFPCGESLGKSTHTHAILHP